jgi:hypothetical protein
VVREARAETAAVVVANRPAGVQASLSAPEHHSTTRHRRMRREQWSQQPRKAKRRLWRDS